MPKEEGADGVILSFRVPKELRRRVKAQAAALDMTVREVIVSLLEEWLQRVEGSQGTTARGNRRNRQGATRE